MYVYVGHTVRVNPDKIGRLSVTKRRRAVDCVVSGAMISSCLCTGNLPDDHDMYYGFTRFAIELNELREEEQNFLPPTDTRFRPDQRSASFACLSIIEYKVVMYNTAGIDFYTIAGRRMHHIYVYTADVYVLSTQIF